jgi:hypothetical protein
MQNHTGNFIILNNAQANVAQNSIHLASTASMSPSVSNTSDMLTNDINALENSLLSLIDQSSTASSTTSEAAIAAAGNFYTSQQQAINGYSTINSILNGSLSQNQYKTIIQQPQSPVSSNKFINQIATTPTNKKTIVQQQQQSPYLNLNLLQSSASSNTGQNPIKLINTSPNVLQSQQQQQRLQMIQTTPQVSQQQAILYTSPNTTTNQSPQQIQIINTTNQAQQQQQQAPTIAFLNINNRMVPLQTVNIQQKQQQQQQQQQSTTQSTQALKFVIPSGDQQQQQFVVGNDSNRIIMSTGQQQAQQKPQQPTYYVVQSSQIQQHLNSSQTQQLQPQAQKVNVVQLSGNTGNNNIDTDSSQQANANLVSQIPEKMKTLEQIQLQLRAYQMKIQNALNNLKRDVSNLTQQQQIQLVLSQPEQITLQKLMQRRKDVQNEIQQLQQKLLAPSANNDQANSNSTANVMIASNSNKQDVYNGIINSINTMKAKNDLTLEELDKLKKLIEYKLTFETKFNMQPAVLNGNIQNENKTTGLNGSLNRNTDDNLFSTSTVQQQQTTNNLPIINIKIQSPNVLQNATSTTLNQSPRVITIAGSPSTATSTAITPNAKNRNILMAQQSPNQQQQHKPISGSIKIRNVPICTVGSFGSTPTVLPQNITPVTSTTLKTKPIRTIIGNTSAALNGNVTITPAANNSVFKLLNYDVLAVSVGFGNLHHYWPLQSSRLLKYPKI